MKKVEFPIDKRLWHPSLIPGAVVLISTYNAEGQANIAPKSWLQMVSFDPPVLMFSGTKGNTTENNILQTSSFVVNTVDSTQAAIVYECIRWFGEERIRKSGFTLAKASSVNAPLVRECRAHLECRLLETKEIGSGFLIFGSIVAASVWDEILSVPPAERYRRLDQVVYLEENLFATLADAIPIRR